MQKGMRNLHKRHHMQHLRTEQGKIVKWVVKEYPFKMQNVGKQQGKQQAVVNTVMNIRPNKTFESFFFLA
jgi:hypothetical protein